jgi:hypothetical protein
MAAKSVRAVQPRAKNSGFRIVTFTSGRCDGHNATSNADIRNADIRNGDIRNNKPSPLLGRV